MTVAMAVLTTSTTTNNNNFQWCRASNFRLRNDICAQKLPLCLFYGIEFSYLCWCRWYYRLLLLWLRSRKPHIH